MNAKRRKRLHNVMDALSGASSELEDIIDEEQDCLDNTPDNLQESDMYSDREELVDNLRYALEGLQLVIDDVAELL